LPPGEFFGCSEILEIRVVAMYQRPVIGSLEIVLPCISTMYFSLWKTPGVSERMWSVNLEGSISGEYQTLGGYSGRPSE